MTARALLTAAFYPASKERDGISGYILGGKLLAIGLTLGVLGWAARTPITGAVLAQGSVTVDTHVKKVQHASGGTVASILVKDGDHVRAGDTLLRLDETVAKANLQVLVQQLDELSMRKARLLAERDGSRELELPRGIAERAGDPEIQKLVAGEKTLFESRRNARAGQKAQLGEQITQLENEITGLYSQLTAKVEQLVFVRKELDGLEVLAAKNYVTESKVMSMRREHSKMQGERGELLSSIARVKGKISETKLKIIQIDQDLRTEVIKDLGDTEAKMAELRERRVTAQDFLNHIDVKAPQSGVVNQSSAHTVGGVITGGEQIMLIVPEGEKLVIEAKIAPQDIDHVRPQQTATVRFAAFSQRTTPEFHGVVETVSPDLVKEADTHASYYAVRIILDDIELLEHKNLKLVPGMPAEVHLNTGERTALSYFLKPLEDQFAKAFREP